ncbi:tRNA-guanine transglycosylase domain protein, partial [Bordetella holmesii H620]
MATPSAACR